MSSLSIRNMNRVIGERELEPINYAAIRRDVHYWIIRRRAKRGRDKWIYVCDFIGTKSEVAEYWKKHFTGKGFRLFHEGKFFNFDEGDWNDEPSRLIVSGGEVDEVKPYRPANLAYTEDMPF